MNDILNKEDIKVLVDSFYNKVRKDALLGGVFAARIENDQWPSHLEKMYSFWNTVLFAQQDYRGNPFAKHADLPIQQIHFERWVALMVATIDERFMGEKAEEVKMRAIKMGALFQAKLAHIQANDGFKSIM